MQTVQIGEMKANFSHILSQIKLQGEEYILEYGRNHEKIAVIIPYEKYKQQSKNRVIFGLLKDDASFSIADDFSISDEEFLGA